MEQAEDPDLLIPVENPLENHVVLRQVFGFVQSAATITDWKHFRLVSKIWHNETLSIWRANACLNLVGNDGTSKNQSELRGTSLSKFLTEQQNTSSISQLSEKPFQNYKLQNFAIDLSDCDVPNSIYAFITSIGQSIKHLSLVHVNFKTESKSKSAIISLLIEKTPNLKSFSMHHVHINGIKIQNFPDNNLNQVHSNVTSINVNTFADLRFTNFPNLKKIALSILNVSQEPIELFPTVITPNQQLPTIIASVKRLKLMNFTNECNYETLIRFRNIRFPALEHLSISTDAHFLRHSGFSDALLFTLLKNEYASLQTFQVFASLCCESGSFPIVVQLPALTEIRVWGNVFRSFEFLRFIPNLKVLHMDLYGFEKQEKMRKVVEDCAESRVVLPFTYDIMIKNTKNMTGAVLHKLEYFQINFKFPIASLLVLSNWMPYLTTLKTVVDSITFPVVCKQWPNLEHFKCMFGSSVSDEDITGLLGSPSNGTALVDLKCLKSFHYYAACNQTTLSDLCVNDGLIRMSQLTDLNICVSRMFSREAETLLTQRITNVKIQRNYLSNPLHQNWLCCKNNIYKRFVFSLKSQRKIRTEPSPWSLTTKKYRI